MVSTLVRRGLSGVDGPAGVIDRDALDRNVADMHRRAGGLPIRLASKSVRVPAAMHRILEHPGYQGVMAFSLAEALDLLGEGFRDILVAYPATDRAALRRLAEDDLARREITVVFDSAEHLEHLAAVLPCPRPGQPPIRLCLDVDAAYEISPRLLRGIGYLGARRSRVRTPEHAAALARQVSTRPGLRLVGVLSYEGQIAGTVNKGEGPIPRTIRAMQRRSVRELAARRPEVVAAIREHADLEFVNGGGTGSLESSAAEGTLTELGAGSGIFAPGLFDHYQGFRHEPAAYFVRPVVRRPGPDWITVAGGGLVASGPVNQNRLPVIDWPQGLQYAPLEGPGEVQTPLRGPAAADLRLGDLVWFRHAKGGELAEHLNEYLVVSQGEIVDTWTTYRGKGWVY